MNKNLVLVLIAVAIFFGIAINLLFIATGLEVFGERASYMIAPLEFIAVIVVGTLLAPYIEGSGFSVFARYIKYVSLFWIIVFLVDYIGFLITCPIFKNILPNLYADPMSLCRRGDLLSTQIFFILGFGMFLQILAYFQTKS